MSTQPKQPVGENARGDDRAPRRIVSGARPTKRKALFQYRSVSLLAVGSIILGVLSLFDMFHWSLAVVPLLGIGLGWLALRQIRDYPHELTGIKLAWTGIALSLVLGITGGTFYTITLFRDVPHGYTLITFDDFKPDPNTPGELIPPKIIELTPEEGNKNTKVFLKGYMYPGRQSRGLKHFIFVPTRGHCNFCSKKLSSYEMVNVTLEGDLTADFSPRLTAVGGKLRIDLGQTGRAYGGLPFRIEADYVR